jgi:AhpD family alkylhydroperoxidase
VELIYLRVSQINNGAYWLDMHIRDLAKTGLPIEKLALGRRRQSLTDTERAALAWAETVTRVAETGVPDEACQARSSARRNWSTSRSRQLDERLQSCGDQLPQHAPGGNQKLSEAHRPRR